MKLVLHNLVSIFGIFLLISCQSHNPGKINEKATDTVKQAVRSKDPHLFQCSPDTLYKDGKITVKLPSEHPGQLVIVSPQDQYFYLQFPPDIMLMSKEDFNKAENLEIPQNISGLIYLQGKALKKPVFGQSGKYRIILSDNIETEFENSNFMDCFIYFIPKVKSKAP